MPIKDTRSFLQGAVCMEIYRGQWPVEIPIRIRSGGIQVVFFMNMVFYMCLVAAILMRLISLLKIQEISHTQYSIESVPLVVQEERFVTYLYGFAKFCVEKENQFPSISQILPHKVLL